MSNKYFLREFTEEFANSKEKKYFTKHLPVQGEIREGDKFNSLKGEIPGSQHVRLFLCSRDIQIGDDVRLGSMGITHSSPSNEINLRYVKGLGGFKVIGEISPDALGYVKEGDEFDESQIYYEGGFQGAIPLNYKEIGGIIKIKGPCGHFH